MDNWDEVRTAYHVARMGTVSGAADALGVHHATVIRHIDALEGRLGVKLFQRHARGYTSTEAGQDLLRVAKATDEQLQQLSSRIKGRGSEVSGELVVTSLAIFAPMLVRALTSFQRLHPEVTVRFLATERVFRLEYGEAHVALRAGPSPEEQDNVVQHFEDLRVALFASQSYVDTYGLPKGEDFNGHRFAMQEGSEHKAPFNRWLMERIDPAQLMFRGSEATSIAEAICMGAGIGFLPEHQAKTRADLVQVLPYREEWSAALWLVTHVDLHRTAKVQAFLKHIKDMRDGAL